jgi:hypothetical protein
MESGPIQDHDSVCHSVDGFDLAASGDSGVVARGLPAAEAVNGDAYATELEYVQQCF